VVGWFGGGRLVALAAVLFSGGLLRGFVRVVHFRSLVFPFPPVLVIRLKNYFPLWNQWFYHAYESHSPCWHRCCKGAHRPVQWLDVTGEQNMKGALARSSALTRPTHRIE